MIRKSPTFQLLQANDDVKLGIGIRLSAAANEARQHLGTMATPTEETFHGNQAMIVWVLLHAGLFTALVYPELSNPASRDFSNTLTFFVILALFAAGLAHLLSLRVSIHPYGISKQTWLGAKEMRWEDVERFYYSVTERHGKFIPPGPHYHFKLVDREGHKVAFSNAVERPSELGQRLIESTFQAMYGKAAQVFNSGAELEFGPITLSRQRGLRIRRLCGYKEIPLDQLSEHRLENGRLYILKRGDKRVTGPCISRIPNVFVLVGLLNAIHHPKS
jgi:hypothetical protein